ncbi:5'-nucleotidase C-terminal domain-containing protein [Gloeocapsa sp. PCC 73106]|uniref:5'-nucleotidase C-terminal domain-containing protein n=1 Tax=Gloeocapsa sp. PCC 73106 TaxID=102232 RepID=UPI0002ABF5D1|nr:5'-nucleotidase C-terminal domain-containing protein [Gloeocapsa sp. PCC 73106]ELR98420.1 5'-nucleotidase/2',3'-cyclic phosphodiesterase-like hydrolase [Gloeocapsa sp. PCC 73106]
MDEDFTLQLLHASDQEAGVPALVDIIGFSAVMNALEDDYDNTIKLTSGDIYISSPLFNASGDIYDNASTGEPAGLPGVADILIQNALGWDAATVGNHEFSSADTGFLNLVAPNPNIVNGVNGGVGIGEDGYPGTSFPYLATNLDYSEAVLPEGVEVVEGAEAPRGNSLSSSTIVDVNGESIGVIGVVTPHLSAIANIGNINITSGDNITTSTPFEEQVDAVIEGVRQEVELLEAQGVNKIILGTHLQQFEIEEMLAQRLVDENVPVDIVIGGGSHRLMANADFPIREDETQVPPQQLQPYPLRLTNGDNAIYVINTAANYRYISRLVANFDEDGVITSIDSADSQAYATDTAGVNRLYDDTVTDFRTVRAKADPEIVAIVEGLANFVNEQDGNIFGQTDFFLNGIRGDVRTQETNLGNITNDAQIHYGQQYLNEYGDDFLEGIDTIQISFRNGGGIRDSIGVSILEDEVGELIQLPPPANPAVDKEEGDVSQLDISNALRFDSDLVAGTVTAAGIYELAEHMVSAIPTINGLFGQIGGFKFSYDPTAQPRTTEIPGERIQNLASINEAGENIETIVENGELVGDPDRTFGVITSSFLANGGDSYPEVVTNQVRLDAFPKPDSLDQAELNSGAEQDALAEYLGAFYNRENGQAPFPDEDTPEAEDERIQNLSVRDDTILNPTPVEGRLVKADFNNDDISDLVWRNFSNGSNGYWYMNNATDGGSFGPSSTTAIASEDNLNWAISGTADFNRNGTEDILWRNFSNGNVGVWLMNNTNRGAIRNLERETNTEWYIGGTRDANGDTVPDLYWRNSATGANGLWYLNEDLGTIAKVSIPTEDNLDWQLVAVDDMNEDDVPDILWRNRTSGQNGIWLMGGEQGQEVTEIVTIEAELNAEWNIRGTGDYNGDGFADIVWRNLANGNNGVWLYDGELSRRAIVSFTTETNSDWQIVHR